MSAECRVFTFKDGALSVVAHDLEIAVEKMTLSIKDDRVEATFDPTSLRVLTAALNERDKHKVEQTIRDEVLESARYPKLRFVSTHVALPRVEGTLELHGKSAPIVVDVKEVNGRWRAEATVHQPTFGIRPFTAMFGTLKIQADVRVVITADRS